MGAPALTSRGFSEDDFTRVVDFIDEAVNIAKEVQAKSKKLKDFKEVLDTDADVLTKCNDLKTRVAQFARNYPMPGHDNH